MIQEQLMLLNTKDEVQIAYLERKKYVDAFQNDQNVIRYFALENGNLENYYHSRILLSKNAKTEIWPLVLEWIRAHDMI